VAGDVGKTHTIEKRKNLQVVSDFLARIGGRTSPIPSLEEDNFRMREGFQRFTIELVEDASPGKSFLESATEPEHRMDFFASSLQRTQLVGHYYTEGQEVPLHYVIVSTIILQRKDRVFHAWTHAVKREYMLAPLRFLPNPDDLRREFTSDLPVILDDSGGDELNYTQLRIAAVNRARELKWETRQQLIGKWTSEVGKDPNTMMVLNDSLLYNHNDELTQNILGFLRIVYVPFGGKEKLANHLVLPEFHRGQLFKVVDPEHKENTKYSWFIKMRGLHKAEPEYGLVRLEMLAANDDEAKRKADDLSYLMVRERFPVTFPAPQWDKLIFPHKLCDQYLNSLVPSSETIQAYFMRD
jgi:hypothetical protein